MCALLRDEVTLLVSWDLNRGIRGQSSKLRLSNTATPLVLKPSLASPEQTAGKLPGQRATEEDRAASLGKAPSLPTKTSAVIP